MLQILLTALFIWPLSAYAETQNVSDIKIANVEIVQRSGDQGEYIANRQLDFSKLNGQIVLLDLWASWCGPCLEETPELVALQKKYAGRLKIISLAMDKKEAVQALLQKLSLNYLVAVVPPREPSILQFAAQMKLRGVPAFVLIAPNGDVLAVEEGSLKNITAAFEKLN